MVMDLSHVRESGNRVLLSFSCGKDSLCAWIVLNRAGFKVTPYYMAFIPGLEFVEDTLAYYEDFFKTHIYRTIHPSLYRWIRSYSSQPPARQEVIDLMSLPRFDYGDVEQGVKRTAKLPSETWTAVGTRWADSAMRRARIPKCGYTESSRKFYPVADLKKDQVIEILMKAKAKLPSDYEMFGRSFDGIDYQYLHCIKRNYPRDYQKILEWFPLQEAELFRAEVACKHGQAKTPRQKGKRNQVASQAAESEVPF